MNIAYQNQKSEITYFTDKTVANFLHMHKELEIVYVKKGKAVAHADTKSYTLTNGDMFIAFPNQIHYYQTKEEGEYKVIIFSPKIIYNFSDILSETIPDTNYIPADLGIDFNYIFENINNFNNDYKFIALNGYINVIMSNILPFLNLKKVNAENNTTLYNILNFCSKNFKNNITLDTLSENLHLNKYYISHLINQKLNQSLNEYINNLRIAEACNLLKETDKKIADISYDVGYGTLRSFNRSFKCVIGLSPKDYRTKNETLKKST